MAATSAINSCDTLEQMPVDKLYEDNAFLTEDDLALYTNSFYTMFPSAYNVFYADMGCPKECKLFPETL